MTPTTPTTPKMEQDTSQGSTLCAHLLGLMGGAGLLFGVLVGSAQACLRLSQLNEGWVKILGQGCAAALFSAAVLETRHRRRRRTRARRTRIPSRDRRAG